MEMEEFQEADVLWPWPDTPPPSPEEEGGYDYDPELYECDAVVIAFSCEPFSDPAASWSSSSSSSSSASSTLSALLSSSHGGFFLSGPSTVPAAGLVLDAREEFLEADVLWPDTAGSAEEDNDASPAGVLWRRRRRCRRVEEAAASAAAAVLRGKCEAGCSRPSVASSPIDIPMATRAQRSRRRASPPAVTAHRRCYC